MTKYKTCVDSFRVRQSSGKVLISNLTFFPSNTCHSEFGRDTMRSFVLFYRHKAASWTKFFLPSVFIDRKQPVDIFLLWEEVGVMCINMERISINRYHHQHWFHCQVPCLSLLSLHIKRWTHSYPTPTFTYLYYYNTFIQSTFSATCWFLCTMYWKYIQ